MPHNVPHTLACSVIKLRLSVQGRERYRATTREGERERELADLLLPLVVAVCFVVSGIPC